MNQQYFDITDRKLSAYIEADYSLYINYGSNGYPERVYFSSVPDYEDSVLLMSAKELAEKIGYNHSPDAAERPAMADLTYGVPSTIEDLEKFKAGFNDI